ncbi:MAG: site-2 protease family protein [Rubrobacteraceae bacterium]|nr:site-2 protease family protein [Rubrobacteraceae bacterium]
MTVIVALLGLICLIVIHELGHMLTAKALGVRVPEFGVGFGPPLVKKKIGQTVYSFRIILLGGFARMAGMGDGAEGPDTYYAKAAWRRALIILAGPVANILAAVAILAGVYMFQGVADVKPVVRAVERGSMAQEVGIRAGDRIVGLDSDRVRTWAGFERQMSGREPGEKVSVTVLRGGSQKTFEGELGADPEAKDRALVGVRPEVETTTYGPLESVGLSVQRCGEITVRLGVFVGQLVTGEKDLYENVTGPVGIATVGSTAVNQGFFLPLLALISLNLALFNLFPILPLDGGHLFFIAAEKVLGRPVSEQTMGKIAAFGLVLVLALFLFATYADLSKIFTGQPFIPE